MVFPLKTNSNESFGSQNYKVNVCAREFEIF